MPALSVFFVDDNADDLDLARRALRRSRAEVRALLFEDPLEAARALGVRPGEDGSPDALPDLLVLDVKMPRMDGFELLSLVRRCERTSSIRAVMLTSSSLPQDEERARALGAGFATKPIEAEEYLELVLRILGLPPAG